MMAWNALESQTRLDHQPIYADMVRTRSWGLLHQPGSLTYAHHDAAGQHTWALNMCGCKFWLIFTLKDEYAHLSKEERNAKFLNIFDSRNVRVTDAFRSLPASFNTPLPFEAYVNIHLVVIEPGCLLHVILSLCLSLVQF